LEASSSNFRSQATQETSNSMTNGLFEMH